MSEFYLNKLVRSTVINLEPYASARDEFKQTSNSFVFLDANENPYENGVNRYPDPKQRNLKTLLATKKNISTDHIFLGNGSDEVLDLLFRIFCKPEVDNIISLPPTYGMYKVLAATNAVEHREVPLKSNFELDMLKINETIDQDTKLLFICSPNNPTGNLIDSTSIETLLNNFLGIIVIDEAYIDFTENKSWLNRLNEFPNLVIVQTLSKAYGLAGIRLGICYASIDIITLFNKIKPPYNVNELTQKKAYSRLRNEELVRSQIKNIVSERERLTIELSKISFIKKVFNSDANFILIKVDNANIRYAQLVEKGIVVRNRSNQIGCEHTLRITVGTVKENNLLIKELNELAI